MQIVCPNCAASYQVGASAIGAAGRKVRCVRCRSIWLQQAEAEITPQAAASVAARGPASDATVAAFQSELGHEPPSSAAAEPPVVEAAPSAAAATPSENGDPAGPSLQDLMAADAAADAPATEAVPQAEADPAPGAALSEIAIPAGEAPPIALTDTGPSAPNEPGPADIESIASRRRRRAATHAGAFRCTPAAPRR